MSTVNTTAFRLTPETLRYLRRNAPPDAARLADALFTRLDTERQGYLRKTDLEKALAVVEPADHGGDASGAEALFSRLDRNGDGRVTRDEFAWSVTRLADQLYQRLKIMNAPRDDGAAASAAASTGAAGDTVLSAEWRTLDGADAASGVSHDFTLDGHAEAASPAARPAAQAGAARWDAGTDFSVLQQIVKLARAYGVNAVDATDTTRVTTRV